jgi:hypothetical protein
MISTIRHQEIFNPKDNDHGITIIGAGAVGSHIFSTLVELGLQNITVYDHDIVEPHNLSNQLFGFSDLNKPKVDGLYEWACQKLGAKDLPFIFKQEYVTPEMTKETIKGTVFLLVDSLETRRQLATSMKGNLNIPRVIDVRMAATHGNILTFSPHSQLQNYLDKTTSSDDDAEVSACGSPFSVTPTVKIISNMAVWQFINVKTTPAAHDPMVNIFLKPFIMSVSLL